MFAMIFLSSSFADCLFRKLFGMKSKVRFTESQNRALGSREPEHGALAHPETPVAALPAADTGGAGDD
jgi:hypothetical protein